MKLEFLAKDAPPKSRAIATVSSAIGANGVDHGVVVDRTKASGNKATAEAAAFVELMRPVVREKLGRDGTSEEIVAALLESEHAARFRVAE